MFPAAPARMPRPLRPGDQPPGVSSAQEPGSGRPPSSSSTSSSSSSSLLPRAPREKPGPRGDAKDEQQQLLRRKINSRERKRMQDLNLAMDALREVLLPYSAAHCQAAPGRKLSKVATLLLARNYILLLGGALRELRRALGEGAGPGGAGPGGAGPGGTAPRLLLAGLPLLAAAPGSLLLAPGAALGPPDAPRPPKYLSLALDEPPCGQLGLPGAGSGGAGGPGFCPCAVCRFPHLVPAGLGLTTVQAHFSK